MPICPRGHESQAEDWCDFCGFPMTPPPGLPIPGVPATPPPAAGGTAMPGGFFGSTPARGTPAPPPGPPPAPAGPGTGAPDLTAGLVTCPICRTPQTGRYCEECGYDYALANPPRPPQPTPPPAPPQPQPDFDYPRANPPQGRPQTPPQTPPGPPGPPPGLIGQPQPAPNHRSPFDPSPPAPPAPPASPGAPGSRFESERQAQPGFDRPSYDPQGFERPGYQPQGFKPQGYDPQGFEQPKHEPGPYEQGQYEPGQYEPGPAAAFPETDDGYERTGPVYAQPGQSSGDGFGTSFRLAPPTAPVPPVRTTWLAVVAADREYFTDMMARSGPEAAGLFFPPYCPERRIPLTGRGQLRIGRRSRGKGTVPEIDLSVAPEDPGASHQHALLAEQADGSWVLVDQDSTNGTTLNGSPDPLPPHTAIPLNDGDRIHVGAWTTITVHRS